ncbi:3'-5' exonuclease [Insolitispirillum peregrinum]|uniref:Exonuclease, DNA polymerase III, epsilon subunit family n=1 Tax=Insolitispirillum peregrinum TaxID=80876 RepID=A0A1N7LF56_9PROT|nr:exonuclease domain-containing protein [Insolitispirillum peregrinum]SIS72440.1 exonuclease, DNA polymerase III, epsilon subunit family [Insolitispirillum peregrinum]
MATGKLPVSLRGMTTALLSIGAGIALAGAIWAAAALLFETPFPALPDAPPRAFAWLTLAGGLILTLAMIAVQVCLQQHFRSLERLRAALLIASANPDGRLPAFPALKHLPLRREADRLRHAAEILISRRLFPNATTDERLRAVLGAIDEGILVVTEHGQISLTNTAAKTMLGEDRLHLGASAFACFERLQLVGAIEQARSASGPISWTLADVDGTHYTARITHLRGHSGTVIRLSPDASQRARPPAPVAHAPRPALSLVAASDSNGPTSVPALPRERPTLRCFNNDEDIASRAIAASMGTTTPSEWDLSLHDRPAPDVNDPSPLLIPRDTPLEDLPVLVFDAETTGLDVKGDRLVQVGGVRLHGARIFHVATIDRLINPQRPIPPHATAIHGISNDMVRDAAPFTEVWEALEPLFRGAVVIGHNIGFDIAMVRRECGLAGLPFIQPPTLDTVLLASLLLPAGSALTLDRVAEALEVDIHGRHTALGDALVTADVYVRLLPLLEAAGVHTYAEAYAFSRKATQLLARQQAMGW